jgi:hypothetical protein
MKCFKREDLADLKNCGCDVENRGCEFRGGSMKSSKREEKRETYEEWKNKQLVHN